MRTDEDSSAKSVKADVPGSVKHRPSGRLERLIQTIRSIDRYGLVLMLLVVSYLADAAFNSSAAGRVVIVALQGTTLALVLQTSGVRRLWTGLAWLYLAVSVLLAIVEEIIPTTVFATNRIVPAAGGVLLFIAPFVILRRIVHHTQVSAQTILGAVAVYLFIGECFAYLFQFIGILRAPFFTTLAAPRLTDYLFFSFTTMTTVGYGNLVPAGEVGQAFAMLEALTGQIYLVVVVARLVSIWAPRNEQPPS
jgi:hypothetical protein